jgi:hypothetical protein
MSLRTNELLFPFACTIKVSVMHVKGIYDEKCDIFTGNRSCYFFDIVIWMKCKKIDALFNKE